MRKILIPLILSLLLSACGFHLRGMIDLPTWLNNIAIISKNDDKELIEIFKRYNIQVNPDPAQAQYWLVINEESIQHRIVSVGASTNPRQFNVTLIIEFMLQSRKGEIIKPSKRIQVSRQVTINNDRILGSTDEETILIKEMKQDAVMQIINQLSHLSPKKYYAN